MHTKILSHLKNLDRSSADIEASALISIDGLVMAATFPMTMQTDDIGAICAGIYNLGHHTSVQGVSGLLEQMLIKCANGHIVIIRVGTECLLMVVVKPDANFEQIFSQSKYLIEKIVMLMEKQG